MSSIRLKTVLIANVIAVFCFFAACGSCAAADSGISSSAAKPPKITETGFLVLYGGDDWRYTSIDQQSNRGDYQTIGIAGHFAADLSRVFPDLRNIPGTLSFYFEPVYEQAFTSGYEIALAFGFQYRLPIYEKLDAFVSFSGAPAYVSSLQRLNPAGTGFTTEETLSFGGYYHIQPDAAITASMRLKHNSNGRTDYPINIYNDWYCSVGYAFFID